MHSVSVLFTTHTTARLLHWQSLCPTTSEPSMTLHACCKDCWIRLAFIGRDVADSISQTPLRAASNRKPALELVLGRVAGMPSTAPALGPNLVSDLDVVRASSSPCLLLRLSSKKWATDHVRAALVDRKLDAPTTPAYLRLACVPPSIDDAVRYFASVTAGASASAATSIAVLPRCSLNLLSCIPCGNSDHHGKRQREQRAYAWHHAE